MDRTIEERSGYIFENLKCVYCESALEVSAHLFNESHIRCSHCSQHYPVVENVPILINEVKSIFSFKSFTSKSNLFFDISWRGKLISRITKFIPSLGRNWVAKENFQLLSQLLTGCTPKAKVLILGGSIAGYGMNKFLKNPELEIIESDVSFGSRTQIIFDAHNIPYKDFTFDLVIAQAVLEHVIDPYRCVEEIHRVLKPDGIVYAETPFMQQVHGGPYDFTRFSRSGQRRLFKKYIEVKSGMIAGSGTALLWSYEYLLLSLFGYTDILRLLIKAFARYTGFLLPYLDFLCKKNPRAIDSASALFFLGRKNEREISDRELIEYYK